jgi:putative Mn2+ efflux pump MntP
VGTGIFLVTLGALLTFAVEDHVPNLDLNAAGLILMLAGAVVIWHARTREVEQRTMRHTEESSDPNEPTRTEETIRETGE